MNMKKAFTISGARRAKLGFTLLEMLVVIGIIAILVTVMVPVVRGVREKAKDSAVKQYGSSIEQALANFAASHDGNYPGVAIDVMAPFPNHGLGDPQLYSGTNPPTNGVSPGVLGGTGSAIPSSTNVYQLLKQVKDTPLDSSTTGTNRYFDALVATGAIDEFPRNPFKSSGQDIANKMINIFRFDPIAVPFLGDFSQINPYLLLNPNSDLGTLPPPPGLIPEPVNSVYAGRVRLYESDPLRDDFNTYFKQELLFATGDFAYVPILSLSAFPSVDNPQTLENDSYRWGTLVSGYLLFGYGWQGNKANQFEEEKAEFGRTGLPGFGDATGGPPYAPACDTPYERAVYALFNGAVYYSRKP